MKLGLNSAILQNCNFEEVIDICSANGLESVEICCWPSCMKDRRYAGVTHINIENLSMETIHAIQQYTSNRGVEISALAYYPNPLSGDLTKRSAAIEHLRKLIKAAPLLGVHHINTFIGRDQSKSMEENLKLFEIIWPPLMKEAEEHDVYIGIENCPMLFTRDEWPGGCNLAVSPHIWSYMFETIPSTHFGLNYDPSHMLLQGMNYIQPIYDFRDRIFHAHIKDIRIDRERLDQVGLFSYPSLYSTPKLPGLGDIDWSKYIAALYDIDFSGSVCIELEDRTFETDESSIRKAIEISTRYMRNYL